MKNIFLLPTNEPSRLHITGSLGLYPNGLTPKSQGLCKNQHIYITSSEEIKERDWIYRRKGLYETIQKATFPLNLTSVNKKIILTTDPKLIADGVQAINEEFLQWFVKNPSCEEVNIESWQTKEEWDLDYKIIIPKEEPKIKLPKLGTDEFNSMCNMLFSGKPKQTDEKGRPMTYWGGVDFTNPNADKISSASTITKEEQKQHLIDMMNGQDVQVEKPKKEEFSYSESAKYTEAAKKEEKLFNSTMMFKQETLEEAAERILHRNEVADGDMILSCTFPNTVKSMVEMAKWQQERMYSEEDMRTAIIKSSLSNTDNLIKRCDEILEQFKKKK